MKKFFITLSLACLVSSAYADLNGSGYYRVRNYGTGRWASLVDNYGSVDFLAGSADLHSLNLSSNTETILADPGSVVYLKSITNYQYDVAAQGTSLADLVANPVFIRSEGQKADNQLLYRIFGTYQGVSKYIADGNVIATDEYGYATIADMSSDYKSWFILPLSADGDNYFGAVPNVNADNNKYCTLFTSFPYMPYSENVEVYYIGRVGFGMAEMIPINGIVPPASPVVIKCAGDNVSDNRLQIMNSEDALPDNSLTGVYFNYHSNNRNNFVAYNPQTMRVLGTCADGSLGFVVDYTLDYIPANTAYLTVPAGSSPEFKCVSTSEFESNVSVAPEQIYFGNSEFALQPQDDYTYIGEFKVDAPSEGNDLLFRFSTSSDLEEYSIIGPYSPTGDNVTVKENMSVSVPFSWNSPAYWVIPNWGGGNISVTLNIQYQYMNISALNAGVDSLTADDIELKIVNNAVYYNGKNKIRIFDYTGKEVLSSNSGSLDINNLPKGVYVVVAGDKSLKLLR